MNKQLIGFMHSFESFGAMDGPGIRSVVFLQGCRFRCLYCHNPDTWEEKAGILVTADELCKKILRYQPYFESSGGGVTVSGGEPLLQAEFVAELFEKLKTEGVHTCLDTSGYIPPDKDQGILEKLISFTDLVLLDVKHIDPETHRMLTGKDNDAPLRFARMLEESNVPMWLRYVVVPGYTDDINDIKGFKNFAASLTNVRKIEFLPFHKLGEFKWKSLGLNYRLNSVFPPAPEFMEWIQST